jgi:hypothetical protein
VLADAVAVIEESLGSDTPEPGVSLRLIQMALNDQDPPIAIASLLESALT